MLKKKRYFRVTTPYEEDTQVAWYYEIMAGALCLYTKEQGVQVVYAPGEWIKVEVDDYEQS